MGLRWAINCVRRRGLAPTFIRTAGPVPNFVSAAPLNSPLQMQKEDSFPHRQESKNEAFWCLGTGLAAHVRDIL